MWKIKHEGGGDGVVRDFWRGRVWGEEERRVGDPNCKEIFVVPFRVHRFSNALKEGGKRRDGHLQPSFGVFHKRKGPASANRSLPKSDDEVLVTLEYVEPEFAHSHPPFHHIDATAT